MNVKDGCVREQGRISRRAFIRGPMLIGGGALALTQMGCDIFEPAVPGSEPLAPEKGRWTVGEMSFRGDFLETGRYGRPEIRAIDPRVVFHDPSMYEIERYDPLTGGRSRVLVDLGRVHEAYLFASRESLTYQHWVPRTPGFADRLTKVCAGVQLVGGRASLTPIPRFDLEVRHIQLVADAGAGPQRVFSMSPVVRVGGAGRRMTVRGRPLGAAPSSAEAVVALDAVRLIKIEARDTRMRGSLVKITATASEAGRLVRVVREVLEAAHLV